jgi:DMSO/TMAO reductase YedYZ molybdopterin-dependent catalytic subunit
VRRTTLAIIAAAASLALAACRPGYQAISPSTTQTPAVEITTTVSTSAVLPSVEVTSYMGKRLSAIGDLYENSIKGPQHIDRKTYRLVIDGEVNAPTSLTYDQVLAFRPAFAKVVTLNCVEGWSVTMLWEGVRVRDLIAKAGGPKPDAKIVIFHAHDGYTSSLPLDFLTNRNILLAYHQNGVPLADMWGWPLQVVAEDRWGYKWVKWIERVEVSSDAAYRGYWESRGYSNSGELGKSQYGP